MKTVFILLFGIFYSVLSLANPGDFNSENEFNSEIIFHQGTWQEALELAEKEGKPIFLGISASWCSSCKKLKAKTFTDTEVAGFYNAQFINVNFDGEKGEGIKLVEKFKVEKYPSLIFVNAEGKVISQTEGYKNPKQLIEIGKQIIH